MSTHTQLGRRQTPIASTDRPEKRQRTSSHCTHSLSLPVSGAGQSVYEKRLIKYANAANINIQQQLSLARDINYYNNNLCFHIMQQRSSPRRRKATTLRDEKRKKIAKELKAVHFSVASSSALCLLLVPPSRGNESCDILRFAVETLPLNEYEYFMKSYTEAAHATQSFPFARKIRNRSEMSSLP